MTEISSADSNLNLHLEKCSGGGFSTPNGRYAGHLYKKESGERCYVSFRNSDNFMEIEYSYPLSESILEELKKSGISEIYIFENGKKLYIIDSSVYMETDNVIDYPEYENRKHQILKKQIGSRHYLGHSNCILEQLNYELPTLKTYTFSFHSRK